jgi:hypothetical protein
MIIVNINNGIGNQLFQYAAARALSLEKKHKLFLNTYQLSVPASKRKLHIDALQIPFNKLTYPFSKLAQNEPILAFSQKYLTRVVVKESNYFRADGLMMILDDYFQGEQYFEKHKGKILGELKLKKTTSELQKEIDKIKQLNSVSIHIRRGDYVQHRRFGLLNLEYYQQAVENISKTVTDPVFVLFSDDLNWVMSNDFFKNLNLFPINFNNFSDMETLMLMSNCKHHIVANSSYSWWGAYLNRSKDKIVMRPKYHWKLTPLNEAIYYPSEWLAIYNGFS